MEKAARGEVAQPAGRQAQRFPDPYREQRNASRVTLGVFVLLGQANHERAHVRAEERLLGADELCGADVPDERARLGAAVEIPGDDAADQRDAEHLEAVSEPPAELAEIERERRDERGGEPHDPADDDEVGESPREQEGSEGPHFQHAVEEDAQHEEGDRLDAERAWHARDELRLEHADGADGGDRGQEACLEPEQRRHALGTAKRRQRGECEQGAADREREAARQRDEPVVLDDEAGGREAVHEEQGGHDGERRREQDDPSVTPAGAEVGENERRAGGCERARADDAEMDPARERDFLAAEEMQQRKGQDSRCAAEQQRRHETFAGHEAHYRRS